MKNISSHIKISALMILFVLPFITRAVSITAKVSKEVRAGDTFVIDVIANTEGQNINTIEGDILFSDRTKNFEVKDVSLAGSGLTLWPRRPSLSGTGDQISFSGGIPGGITGEVPLFKIVVTTKQPGEFRVGFGEISAYANDGKGTALTVTRVDQLVPVMAPGAESVDQWNSMISTDNIPPQPFQITLYKDPQLYGGQKFISFPAIDSETGIAYYEVQEGNTLPIRSGDQYVLIDQKIKQPITVTAFDIAGNARSGVYTGKTAVNWYAVIFWTLILFIIKKRKSIIKGIKKIKLFKRNARKNV